MLKERERYGKLAERCCLSVMIGCNLTERRGRDDFICIRPYLG